MATQIPLRMNPVTVKLRKYEKTATIMDDDFNEPQSVRNYSTEYEVRCQVVYGIQDKVVSEYTGDASLVKGHLTFRKRDVTTVIETGDRIVEIAGESFEYEIDEIRRSGHLKGRANLLMAFFVEPVERNSMRT